MTGQKITQKRIIECAFAVWGKNGFKDMSLTHISEALSVSKAALYRYFNSKEALIVAMQRYIEERFEAIFNNPSLKDEHNSPPLFIAEQCIHYFSQKPFELFFFTIILTKNPEFSTSKRKLKFVIDCFNNYIKEKQITLHYGTGEELFFYTMTTSIFYLSFALLSEYKKQFQDVKALNDAAKKKVIVTVKEILTHGFGCTHNELILFNTEQYERIEKNSFVQDSELPQRPKILEAIAQIVAKEGIWNVTLNKIAKTLAMSKSSLYFYFDNKNAMLENLIRNELEIIGRVFTSSLHLFDDSYEKIYSLLCKINSLVLKDPEHVKIINWFNFQSKDIESPDLELLKQRFSFLIEMLEEKKLQNYTELFFFPIIFLVVQSSKNILFQKNKIDAVFMSKNTRFIFEIFLNGLQGGTK